ncbi:MAG: hypothetical protein WC375_05800 [Methanomassiliicoccales archaeon]|jgi:hypothetical protein
MAINVHIRLQLREKAWCVFVKLLLSWKGLKDNLKNGRFRRLIATSEVLAKFYSRSHLFPKESFCMGIRLPSGRFLFKVVKFVNPGSKVAKVLGSLMLVFG